LLLNIFGFSGLIPQCLNALVIRSGVIAFFWALVLRVINSLLLIPTPKSSVFVNFICECSLKRTKDPNIKWLEFVCAMWGNMRTMTFLLYASAMS
jgi:hypothetical protein